VPAMLPAQEYTPDISSGRTASERKRRAGWAAASLSRTGGLPTIQIVPEI
jgi:hypothetical protein